MWPLAVLIDDPINRVFVIRKMYGHYAGPHKGHEHSVLFFSYLHFSWPMLFLFLFNLIYFGC